jgi:hypothetical protein
MTTLREAVDRRPWLVSLALALLFVPLKIYGSHVSYLNTHAARDWERGWEMAHLVRGWWHGPELIFRGTIPGWFFNALTALFQFPTRNPFFAAMGPGLLYCGAIFFFTEAAHRVFSLRVAVVAALAYGLFPLGTVSLRYLWNPSYLYIFTAIAFYGAARGVMERRGGFLLLGLGSLLAAAQIHLSGYFGAAAFLLLVGVFRVWPRWWHWLVLAVVELIFIGPYFIYQVQHNWPDRAAQYATALDRDMDAMHLSPNPTFLVPFAMMGLHQPPLDAVGVPQTFPFSYFERFYESSAAHWRLGLVTFVLSIPLALLMVMGGFRAMLPRRIGMWGSDDDEALRRRIFVIGCLVYLAAVCLPQALWNPRAQGFFVNGNWGVPVRYLTIAWPVQFLLLAAALHWLEQRNRSLYRAASWALAPALCAFLILVVEFHREAIRTGEPFNYVITKRPVHALRDKAALMKMLVTKHGLNEEGFHARTHLSPGLLRFAEENLEYEWRWAMEENPQMPPLGENTYFFIHRPEEKDQIAGDYEQIDYARFGSLAVLVYRPLIDLEGWEPDGPIGWY